MITENEYDTVRNEPMDTTDNMTISKPSASDMHNTTYNINGNKQAHIIRGLSNNDNVSCYANSVIQIIFHCESLITEIRNNQLGPSLRLCLQQYDNDRINVPETRCIREYSTNDFYIYSDIQQQDCVQQMIMLRLV